MMHYRDLSLDWNTLDSVRAVHSLLEASALAFFALLVLFEVLAHVYDEHPKMAKGFERAGLWFFGVAVLAEILAYPYSRRNDELSERVIVSLNGLAGTADQKARQAVGDSSLAIAQSREAKGASGKAVEESGKAASSAFSALDIASAARTEADSFEKDIISAKQQATDAESHLADALRRVADATAALDRIKSPRTLTNVPKLLAALQPFQGTEYVFSAVYSDEESLLLLKSIEDVLQRAGWKRAKSIGGFPAININGTNDPSFSVPAALTDGIRVRVESPDAPFADNATLDRLPTLLRAAVSLNIGLSSSVSPSEPPINSSGDPHPVNDVKGDSKVIQISVGKKPTVP